nr:hypothetical protein Iba_chr08dCG11950 [Ipomoea batatas]
MALVVAMAGGASCSLLLRSAAFIGGGCGDWRERRSSESGGVEGKKQLFVWYLRDDGVVGISEYPRQVVRAKLEHNRPHNERNALSGHEAIDLFLGICKHNSKQKDLLAKVKVSGLSTNDIKIGGICTIRNKERKY